MAYRMKIYSKNDFQKQYTIPCSLYKLIDTGKIERNEYKILINFKYTSNLQQVSVMAANDKTYK